MTDTAIKIVYDDENNHPKVFTADGKQLKGVTDIQIELVEVDKPVKATISFERVELDLKGVLVEKLIGEDDEYED